MTALKISNQYNEFTDDMNKVVTRWDMEQQKKKQTVAREVKTES